MMKKIVLRTLFLVLFLLGMNQIISNATEVEIVEKENNQIELAFLPEVGIVKAFTATFKLEGEVEMQNFEWHSDIKEEYIRGYDYNKENNTIMIYATPGIMTNLNEEGKINIGTLTIKGEKLTEYTVKLQTLRIVDASFQISTPEVENPDIVYTYVPAQTPPDEPDNPEDLYIKSTKYSITSKNCIERIVPNTTLAEFKERIQTNGKIKIYNKEEKEIGEEDLIATGMTLKIGKKTYSLAVIGDLSGDGKLTIVDLSKILLHMVELETLQGPYLRAADINQSGDKITAVDLSQIKLLLVGLMELQK